MWHIIEFNRPRGWPRDWPMFCCHRSRGFWWVRMFGFGLMCKQVAKHPLLFSERSGLNWGVQVGGYYFELLF